MQKLRGYLALGIFIMGIVSFLCLLLPLIEITDDALMLMMLAVPPLICGLIIALALHMLLYTLLLVLYGCRIQLVALYFLHIRRKTVGWRVQYLPAAERKVGILLAAVPWEQETGDLQQRAQIVLYYVQSVLAILFYALAVNLYGTASAIACLVLAWGYAFLSIIMPPSEIRKRFQPEKRRKMWQMQCLLAENLTDHLFTEMPEEYFAPPDKIQDQNDAALMINCSARLMMQNRYGEALDILTMLALEHREQTKRLWWQLIPRGVLCELALDKPGYFLKEYDTLYMQKELRKHEKQPLVWRTAYAVRRRRAEGGAVPQAVPAPHPPYDHAALLSVDDRQNGAGKGNLRSKKGKGSARMKNRTFQRLFPLLRMGSILLAAVLFCAALIGVNAQLTVGTNEERNLATYLGLALTAVVTYLLQDVPKMLVGRHFGWKLVRYEAFGRVYQADGTGAFVRVPVPAQSRLRYQPYLLPPEDAPRHDVTLYTLCPLLYGGALAVVFGVLTLLTLGRPVSLVLCELAMGGVVLVMTCILPMDERFIASPMAIARMLRDPEQLAEWLYFARMKANGGVEVTDVSIENIPQPATVKTCQDAICVFQRAQIALMVQCDARKAYGLMKQVLESEARLSYTAWKLLLSDGVVAELLAGEPGEFTALYRGKAGAAIRQVMFRMVDYALPAYAVAMLVTHEAREAEVVRNTLAPVREKMPELDALMKAIEEKAARIEN